MRRLLRPLCYFIGHDWAQPITIRESKAIAIFRTRCHRCHATILGDWDWMEDNGAWDHFRSAL